MSRSAAATPFDYKFIIKLIIIGDMGVGKSCFLHCFTEHKFLADNPHTIGVEFGTKIIELDHDLRVKLQIWDTAGQERFRSVTRSYYRGAASAIMVYDISRRSTFNHLNTWLSDVKNCCHEKAVIFVVGNKSDLNAQREVTFEEGKQWAVQHGLLFAETTAKSDHSEVEKVFLDAARTILELVDKGELAIGQDTGVQQKVGGPGASIPTQSVDVRRTQQGRMQRKCC